MNKKIWLGVIVLIFGLFVFGCGGDGDGSFTFSPIDPSTLPSFDETPVSDQGEAEVLAGGAMEAVTMLLLTDLGIMYSMNGNNTPSLSQYTFGEDETINHKGLRGHVRWSYTINDSGNSVSVNGYDDILIRADGTQPYSYGGKAYKITGTVYELNSNFSGSGNMATGAYSLRGYYAYRNGFTVTSEGRGMKITTTANITITSERVTGTASVKVYNSSNQEIASYNEIIDESFDF